MASSSNWNDICDKLGVTDRYTGYRNNLNRTYKVPKPSGTGVRFNRPPCPRWTPEPQWTPNCSGTVPIYDCGPILNCAPVNPCDTQVRCPTPMPLSLPVACHVEVPEVKHPRVSWDCGQWSLKGKVQEELSKICQMPLPAVEPAKCHYEEFNVKLDRYSCRLDDMPKPKPYSFKPDPVCEVKPFEPLPKYSPQFGCGPSEIIEVNLPCPPKPMCYDITSSCGTIPIVKEQCKPRVTRGCFNYSNNCNKPDRDSSFAWCNYKPVSCVLPLPSVDMSRYARRPRSECYVRGGWGKKADKPRWVPHYIVQREQVCGAGIPQL